MKPQGNFESEDDEDEAVGQRSLAFTRLVKSFHTLTNAPVYDDEGLDLTGLDIWAHDQDQHGNDGVRCSAAFVLNCWNSRVNWKCGKFDMFDALNQWDASQQLAFRVWAANPWRP